MNRYFNSIYRKTETGMNHLHRFLSKAAFPDQCVLCGSYAFGMPLCYACTSRLKEEASLFHETRRCRKCGKPLLSEKDTCLQCRQEDSPIKEIQQVLPAFTYILDMKKLLYAWKIEGRRRLTPFFADVIHEIYENNFSGLPLVPVPPRPGKIRTNGWDQTDSLAGILAMKYSVPIVKYLVRREGQQQKKLGRRARLQRETPYQPSAKLQKMKPELLPEHVVLLDDVMTTGSTLGNCAEALVSSGIKKVSAMTLFTVPV